MKLSDLSGLGPKRLEALYQAGIRNPIDLINCIPRKYEDRRFFTKFEEWSEGQLSVLSGRTLGLQYQTIPREMLKVQFECNQGPEIQCIYYGKVAKFLNKKIKENQNYVLIGNLSKFQSWQLVHPEMLKVSAKKYQGEYVPIYPMSEVLKDSGISQAKLRQWIKEILNFPRLKLDESLSDNDLKNFNLCSIKESYFKVHFAKSPKESISGFHELKVREIIPVARQMTLLMKERQKTGASIDVKLDLVKEIRKKLPFEILEYQENALSEIIKGLKSSHQSQMLLQADVGAGKTIISFLGIASVLHHGHQIAIMAPTEVLAKQWYHQAKNLFPNTSLGFLSGSLNLKEKQVLQEEISNGHIQLVVGTHALFQKSISFNDLRFVIIDEQHRFGVDQRQSLLAKGDSPDLLMLSATPIPRSLVQTLYGDLHVISVKGKPSGRKDTQTRFVPDNKRNQLITFLESYLNDGGRAYWILPKIDGEEDVSIENRANEFAARFTKIPHAVLHGRQTEDQKLNTLNAFRDGEIQFLISTTVVEVGVDVPEANMICIEGADRFGLSQLHQLRGRVGRGGEDSWCFLLSQSEESQVRLKEFSKLHDGFEISELDLQYRGAGDLLGNDQSGWSGLRFTDYLKDSNLIQKLINQVVSGS